MLHTIFSTFGYILLSVSALIFLLLVVPLPVKISYRNNEFTAKAIILLIPIRLFPRKKKPKNDKKEVKPEKKKEQEGSKFTFDRAYIKPMLPVIKRFLKQLSHSFSVRAVALTLYVQKADPSLTAIASGRIFSGLLAAAALLSKVINIRYRKILVIPDFLAEHSGNTEVDCTIVIYPCILLAASLILLLRMVRIIKPKAPMKINRPKQIKT